MEETRVKLIFAFLLILYSSITCTYAAATISANQTVRYNETIVSSQQTFELGFFRPGKSMNYYVGIWYQKILNRTVVWVANPNTPLADTSCELTLTLQGFLILQNTTTSNVIWSSVNSSTKSVRNPIGQLLDTGNFIIYEEGDVINRENPIWQSFDLMTDTLLPGVKLGWNLVTGNERHLTSWKSEDDPASSEFSYSIDTRGYPQTVIKEGQEIKFQGGPWNGLRYTGSPNMRPNWFYNFTFVLNLREIYYQYNLVDTSVFTRLVLQPSGRLERLLWIDSEQKWSVYLSRLNDRCDQYGECGPFGSCNIDKSPICECLKGFEPTSPDQWKITDWSQGCQHTIPLDCNPGKGFNKYSNLKLPDTEGSWYNQTMTLVECEKKCKSNCSCTAYTNSNISGTGSGCLLWFGGLIDIRTFVGIGDTLYIRLSASELDSIKNSKSSSAVRRGRVIVPVASVVLVIIIAICLYYRFNRKKQHQQGCTRRWGGDSCLDSLLFDKTRSELLDWPARYHIIIGVARGLVYLHRDSRLKIIHRDLKVSNILLGNDMNPKISDFGTVRTFGGNQTEANTNTVVGTYGYMAPEYAGDGIFSVKSYVYRFGVLVLEIVCGKKNRGGFVHKEYYNNLIGHAWELHNEGRSLQLVAKC
ncbi:hypothetical protein L1987_85009 [Smallanthus sonchifolius]|uniref:Uncharacterized protein n=1 Tax=Smallanthus sonchifolius TaxID=185202 RepID=A0ACB8XVS0_9ASTR|nr:hypothetical protein L1987_85009 [Smallanthus sonchifolius]